MKWKYVLTEPFFMRTVPDEVSAGVGLPAELDWAVAVEELLEEGGAAQPQPGTGVHAPISVQGQLVKHLCNNITRVTN